MILRKSIMSLSQRIAVIFFSLSSIFFRLSEAQLQGKRPKERSPELTVLGHLQLVWGSTKGLSPVCPGSAPGLLPEDLTKEAV